MTGKDKCRVLKELSRMYVKINRLDMEISECCLDEECCGMCDKCEKELSAIWKAMQDGIGGDMEYIALDDEDILFHHYGACNTEVIVAHMEDSEVPVINMELEDVGLSEATF